MQGNRQARKRVRTPPKPLTRAVLEELALAYVARFATSAGKLERYLQRKLRERGWSEDEPDGADVPALISRFVDKGYVDDEAYARMRSSDLLRRGYGANRVRQALGEAGIVEGVRESVQPGEAARRRAALHMARKRRFGPFAVQPADREKREKQIAALLRAGHSFDHARAVLEAESEERAEEWLAEAEEWEE
ncbi:regulatory protein RecX [Aurantiacibacter aquimixticola]|uniref:Regulatory protein RecX n=1 Tax=Aurantiacibacter aquimixticola TaxID=1958945 RepID=A0A419RVN1_9SPHN|nr:regulatory protein RecX [Aurantiacibacter aquimixticola]RJY09838.1 RecX family transcriptional regulator [Aurantiacibacter aquimixticola]